MELVTLERNIALLWGRNFMPLVSSGEKMDECKFCNESNGKLWPDLYFGGEWFFTTVVRIVVE